MRSPPAISASSAAAVPVPRSLCGWIDSTMASRRSRWRCIHSTMSAKMLGVLCSTVDGRLMMHLWSGVGCQTVVTASTTRLAKGNSVPENISGEYSKVQAVPGWRAAPSLTRRAWVVASSTMPSSSSPSTTRRITGAVALYRCTMARGTPTRASKLRLIRWSRACVSTWIVTSSGISRCSISSRTKSKSACDADGKPTSISLKPILTSAWKSLSLRAGSIGSISAWLPSRRSTLHHVGARLITASGQRRSVRRTGAKARYLVAGWSSMGMELSWGQNWVRGAPQLVEGFRKCKRPAALRWRAVDPGSCETWMISAPDAPLVAAWQWLKMSSWSRNVARVSAVQADLVGLVGGGGDHTDRPALHLAVAIHHVARDAVGAEQRKQHPRRVQADHGNHQHDDHQHHERHRAPATEHLEAVERRVGHHRQPRVQRHREGRPGRPVDAVRRLDSGIVHHPDQ